jgi:hypothetical protein
VSSQPHSEWFTPGDGGAPRRRLVGAPGDLAGILREKPDGDRLDYLELLCLDELAYVHIDLRVRPPAGGHCTSCATAGSLTSPRRVSPGRCSWPKAATGA